MLRKFGLKLVSSFLMLVIIPLWVNVKSYASGSLYALGQIVSATPFDFKIKNTLISSQNLSSALLQSDELSVEKLFQIARSFRYVHDRGDTWQSAQETEARRAGDCEDKAVWLFSQLTRLGYANPLVVIGRYRSIDSTFHVWIVCENHQGEMLILDPSMQKRPWSLSAVDSGFYKPLYAYDGKNSYRYFKKRS